jgi:acylphosphatase
MTERQQNQSTERMTISGELAPETFLPWIERHAAKLGLARAVFYASDERIELDLSGPEELIDMMEMGCSLGPIEVWVETIERHALG